MVINPFKPSIQFLGHWQTDSDLHCLQTGIYIKNNKKIANIPDTPKIENKTHPIRKDGIVH